MMGKLIHTSYFNLKLNKKCKTDIYNIYDSYLTDYPMLALLSVYLWVCALMPTLFSVSLHNSVLHTKIHIRTALPRFNHQHKTLASYICLNVILAWTFGGLGKEKV